MKKGKLPEIVLVPIGKLHLNPDNPRGIKTKDFESLVKSLKDAPEMFKARPLLVSDRTGKLVVIGGNMRLRAAKKLEYKEVPCIVLLGLTEAKEKEIAIKDNGAWGEWDWDALANAWSDLPLTDWGVDIPADWGEQPEPKDAEPQIDKAAELNKKWKVKTGDLFRVGDHRLLCGDSTKREDVERVMGKDRASLFCTDPPYGVNYGELQNASCRHTKKWKQIENDTLKGEDTQKFLEETFTTWLPFLIDRCAWYIWHAQKVQGYFTAAAAAAANVLYHRQIVWVKPSLILGRGHFHWRHELCLYGWRKGHEPNEPFDRAANSVWEFATDNHSTYLHPTQKPIECFSWPMKYSTGCGDICAEPFAGSGTQFIAVENMKRKCFGVEIDPNYCAVILERMSMAFTGIKIEKIKCL